MARPTPSPPIPQDRALAPREKYAAIEQTIASRTDDIVAVLAEGLDQRRFLNVALAAVARQPSLLDCHPSSFVLALRDADRVGPLPVGPHGRRLPRAVLEWWG